MTARIRLMSVSCVWLALTGLALAQPTPIPPPPGVKGDPVLPDGKAPPMPPPKLDAFKTGQDAPPPSREIVAARVNGQTILELSVYRGLLRHPPQRREELRKDVLNY